jgi:uncharacterized metal-binding protein
VANALIYACSGAADVGALSDLAARRLSVEGVGKMDCLAAIAACHGGKLANAREADVLFVIDGCPQSCASKVMRAAGFETCKVLQLAETGFAKGASPANAENAAKAVAAAKAILE